MKQNILKRWLVVLLVALVGGPAALAQQSKIAVASFTRMETDITARVTAPKKDQNGEISYLPDRQAVYFLSYVGNEGNYAYMIEGTLNSIKMRTRE